MLRNDKRILTTHAGSLPRPKELLDMMKVRADGKPYDKAAYDACVKKAVADIVKKQVETGVDIVSDGEMSKIGFFMYANERLAGYEKRPGAKYQLFAKEVAAFPEYYESYFARAMLGGTVVPPTPIFCVGPVSYVGQEQLKKDIDNLKAAVKAAGAKYAFMPSTAPSAIPYNEYYKSEEDYFHAVGEAMRTEYKAIADAGFLLQIDDPFLADIFEEFRDDKKRRNKVANLYIEVINHAIRGIPEEQIRFHTCYGINEGPRIFESSLFEMLPYMLKIKTAYYSFEAANCRHEHEYHVFESVKLPKNKVIIPGVITHASNIVEHPELIAERIMRYAKLVGRENVMPGGDCGFSSQACYHPEVNPKVMWEKFKSMALGARIASKKLWASKGAVATKAPAKRAALKRRG